MRGKQERRHPSGMCLCGCGGQVVGRAAFVTAACRKRAQRMRQAGSSSGYMRDGRHGWKKVTRLESGEILT
jgi:hypothetical protein